MTPINLFKKWKDNNPKIENVVLFVSDSLRWDYLPESIAKRGITFKTIASSLYTASSFPSIATGFYPNHHGVYSFFDKVPKSIPTLLNVPGYNTSLWTENTWIDFEPPGSSQIHTILRCKNPIPLEQLDPPFIYMEDEKGGHCPYGWSEDDIYKEYDCKKFFYDYGKRKNSELRKRYQMGINRSMKEFEKRIKILEKRKLMDNTLIIFLSDHGELLGEYGGIIGHGNPTSPELVYVPTVFIHPNLPAGKSFGNSGVLRHVDLFPSILDLLNIDLDIRVDGISLFHAKKLPDFGYNYFKFETKKRVLLRFSLNFELIERSIWDKSGGCVFKDGSNTALRLLYAIYLTTISNGTDAIYLRGKFQQKPIRMLNSYFKILRNYFASSIKYGYPSFDFQTAQQLIRNIEESKINVSERDRIKSEIGKLKKEEKI